MLKTAIINVRIDPQLKERAEKMLKKTGLTAAEAIRLFYTQVCLHQGLPFEIKVPNKQTKKAMQDARAGRTHKIKDIDDFFEEFK